MTAKTEGVHNAEFLLSKGNGQISFEKVTVASGAGVLLPGTMLDSDDVPVVLGETPTIGNAAKIVYGHADATDADVVVTVVARFAEVHGDLLSWPAGASGANKTAAAASLATAGIIVR